MNVARNLMSVGVIALAVLSAVPAAATTVDLSSGTTGSDSQQSFYQLTRGADVTVLGTANLCLSSMTVNSLNFAGPGTVYARIYDAGGALVASASVAQPSGGFPRTVVVPISASLNAGASYRLCFFMTEPFVTGVHLLDPAPAGPGGFPYADISGRLRVNQAYAGPGDAFPTAQSNDIPYMLVETCEITPTRVLNWGRVKSIYL